MVSKISVVLLAALLGACAFTPHEVTLTATAPTDGKSMGNGTTVSLEVTDDREVQVVGQRGVGMQGASITAPTVLQVIRQEVTSGLKSRGFTVVTADTAADTELEVTLRTFRLFIQSGFWTGRLNTDVAINIVAEKGSKDLKERYRHNDKEAVQVVPEGKTIDQKLNAGLTNVLTQIVYDDGLMTFLANPPAQPSTPAPGQQGGSPSS